MSISLNIRINVCNQHINMPTKRWYIYLCVPDGLCLLFHSYNPSALTEWDSKQSRELRNSQGLHMVCFYKPFIRFWVLSTLTLITATSPRPKWLFEPDLLPSKIFLPALSKDADSSYEMVGFFISGNSSYSCWPLTSFGVHCLPCCR